MARNIAWVPLFFTLGAAAQQTAPPIITRSPARQAPQDSPVAKAALALPRKNPGRAPRFNLWPDGTLRSLGDFQSQPYAGAPEVAARRFLEENTALFGPGLAPEFQHVQTNDLLGLRTVRMRQVLDGYPVLGKELVLSFNQANAVENIQAKYVSRTARKGAWNTTQEKAIAAARATKTGAPVGDVTSERAWHDDGVNLVPVWVVRFATSDGDWQFLIAADSGKILETKNLRVGQTARQGFAFPANPVVSPLQRVQLANLTSANQLRGTNTIVYSYLRSLQSNGDRDTAEHIASPDGSGNYPFMPPDPRFSEVQAYYTLDRASQYFRNMGFPGLRNPIEAVVLFQDCEAGRGCEGQFNAFFSPLLFNRRGGVVMYLTEKGGDTSWDADAVIHEFGHAIVNALAGEDQGETFGALNEGVADYFSSSLQEDPNVGEFFAVLAGERMRFLRTVENDNVFPGSLVGEIHVDGNIWSGALWDVRNALGREKADRIALLTMASAGAQAEFFDAASVAVAAANRLYGSGDAGTVETIMRDRGLLSQSAELASIAVALEPGGQPAPGQIGAAQAGSILLADQQFRFTVPPQATTVQVEVASERPVVLLSSFRSPVVVNDDGTTNAEYITDRGTRFTFTIDANSDPEIQTGTYYIVLGNTSGAAANYAVRVNFLGDPEGPPLRLTRLTLSGPPVKGSIPTGPLLGSRLFVLDVPAQATGVAVGVEGDTDVDLYIRANAPVVVNNQGLPEADVALETAENLEVGLIARNTIPALRPGRYYLGVLNYDDTKAAHFEIAARSTDVALPATEVSALGASARVALVEAFGAARLSNQQFTVQIPDSARGLRLTFESDVDATVYLRRASAVNTNAQGRVNADFLFRTREQQNVSLERTSARPLQPGTYYVAVSNSSAQRGTVTITSQVF